jgi:hypothetical protein
MDDAAGGSGERVTGETGDVVAQSTAVAFRVSLFLLLPFIQLSFPLDHVFLAVVTVRS